jgi:transposase-like protein
MQIKRFIDFPDGQKGQEARKAFWLSEDGLALIGQYRREGAAIEDIANLIGISGTTFYRWQKASPELSKTLGMATNIVNGKVENALLKRALGYDDIDEVEELIEGELRVTRRVRRHVPPDVKACLEWLYSRRPDRWHRQQQPDSDEQKEIEAAKRVIVAIRDIASGAIPEAEKKPEDNNAGTSTSAD